jgi:hypothetical protein
MDALKQCVVSDAERAAFIKRAVGVMYVDADGKMLFDKLPVSEPAPAAGSDTPRTDANAAWFAELVKRWTNAQMPTQVICGDIELTDAELTRQLERELADAEHSNMNHRDYIGRLEVDRKDLRDQLAAALAEVREQARLLSMSGERESGLLATIQQMEDEIEQQSWKVSPAMAQAQIDQLNAKIAELGKNYHELIYGVGKKYEDETRHQTALRYILAHERNSTSGPDAARSASKEGQP